MLSFCDSCSHFAMDQFVGAVLDFVKAHSALAPFVVGALAFGESLAFISLLLPATVILVGSGGIIRAAGVNFWPVWAGAAIGAILGDWVSYWVGYRYKGAIRRTWPLSRRPGLLPRGQAFFDKWGLAGVILGRFFGPLRCIVPLIAGICAMPIVPFQCANVISAALWATAVLAPGCLAVDWLLN
jgi:membrane protein DedA with SNARE-associated domain